MFENIDNLKTVIHKTLRNGDVKYKIADNINLRIVLFKIVSLNRTK